MVRAMIPCISGTPYHFVKKEVWSSFSLASIRLFSCDLFQIVRTNAGLCHYAMKEVVLSQCGLGYAIFHLFITRIFLRTQEVPYGVQVLVIEY